MARLVLRMQSIKGPAIGEPLQRVHLLRLLSLLISTLQIIFLFHPQYLPIKVEIFVQVSQPEYFVCWTYFVCITNASISEEEATSSTTPTEVPPRIPPDPLCWTSENVISYISYYYPLIDSKGDLCDLFRQHVSKRKFFRVRLVSDQKAVSS